MPLSLKYEIVNKKTIGYGDGKFGGGGSKTNKCKLQQRRMSNPYLALRERMDPNTQNPLLPWEKKKMSID
jgi:hypothetical protein